MSDVKRLATDEQKNWFLIPEDELEQFYDWVNEWQGYANFESTETYRGPEYDECRVDITRLRITEYEEVSE